MWRMMLRFWSDRRGATTAQFVLVMPIMIGMLAGSYGMWQLIAARQIISQAAYEAARFLQVEGVYISREGGSFPGDWEAAARELVEPEITAYTRQFGFTNLEVRVTAHPSAADGPKCPPRTIEADEALRTAEEAMFAVRVSAEVDNPLRVVLPRNSVTDIPKIRLEMRRVTYIECQGAQPTPQTTRRPPFPPTPPIP